VCWSDLNLGKERGTGERVWGVCEELVKEFGPQLVRAYYYLNLIIKREDIISA
jgi:hypothetical protein